MGRNRKRNVNPFAQRKRDNKQFQPYDKRSEPYQDIVRENAEFETYYKHQKVCPEDEYNDFITALKKDLPATFRLTAFKGESKRLLEIVKEKLFVDYLSGVKDLNEENDEELKPKNLEWYPNELAWQLQLSRKNIRRSEKLFKLHNFLISETKSGNISRQEGVSMIPPLLLDVKSHHKCLDLCAAPGSKTAQIIEALHSDLSVKGIPKGYVIANDVDNKRCYMLVHQSKRLNSPCYLITNCDAARFPNLYGNNQKVVKFDRILADVPCSGDGTMRKNADIWLKWKPANSLGLHGLQYRIAKRAAEMLEIGGRMVYSTCSINPIENEAVICRLIREARGTLEVVDASTHVKGLKYNQGMTYWEVATKDLKFYSKYEDVPAEFSTLIHKEMFPPPSSEIAKYNLQHCIRVLPHQNNTGAFFIAVLEKKQLLPWEKQIDEDAIETKARTAAENNGDGETIENPRKKKKLANYGHREDPFIFFKADEEIYETFKKFYQLSDDFDPTCLLTRCATGKKKNVYLCSPEVREILRNNENNIKLINSGVKTFSRCDNKNMECQFRLVYEGFHNIDHLVGDERRINVERDDLIKMLNNLNPLEPPLIADMSESVQKQHEKVSSGSCIIHYNEGDDLELRFVGWRGNKTLRAYIDVNDSIHMLRLVGADLSKYDVNKFEEKAKRELAKTDEGDEEMAQDDDQEQNELHIDEDN